MFKTIAVINVTVSLFGLLFFIYVKKALQKRLNDIIKNKKK